MLLTIFGFLLCAAVIFFSGTKLARYGDQMAELTGMGKAWFGLIMMASVRYFAHTMPVISVIPCHFQKRFSKVKKFVNY